MANTDNVTKMESLEYQCLEAMIETYEKEFSRRADERELSELS